MDRNLETLLARFEAEYLEVNSITPRRRIEQQRLLCRLASTIDHPLTELTQRDLQMFVGADLKRGLHPNTARKYLGMIRSFTTWSYQAGLLSPELYAQLKMLGNPRGSSGQSQPKPYTIAEIGEFKAILAAKYPVLPVRGKGSRALKQFLAGRTPRLQRHLWRHARRLQFEAMIALALEQGLRGIEIYRLTIPALHYDNDQIVVLTAKQGPGRDVNRTVPYTAHARQCVREWLDFRYLLKPPHESPWLQLDYVNGLDTQLAPLTEPSLHTALRVFDGGWRWHRFRHTAATEWLRSKVPIEKVQRFMGHATIEQTLAYVQLLDGDVEDAFGEAEADFAKRLGLAA